MTVNKRHDLDLCHVVQIFVNTKIIKQINSFDITCTQQQPTQSSYNLVALPRTTVIAIVRNTQLHKLTYFLWSRRWTFLYKNPLTL